VQVRLLFRICTLYDLFCPALAPTLLSSVCYFANYGTFCTWHLTPNLKIIMERRFLGFDDWTKQSFTLVPGPKTRTMCGYGPIYFAGALRTAIDNPRDDADGKGGDAECEAW
jgi:hypothetical protein